MTECPVGYLLREAPHVYESLELASLVENASPSEFEDMTRYAQRASRLFRAEQERIADLDRESKSHGGDADHASRALRRRG